MHPYSCIFLFILGVYQFTKSQTIWAGFYQPGGCEICNNLIVCLITAHAQAERLMLLEHTGSYRAFAAQAIFMVWRGAVAQ
jgi:hypothetical protein